MSAIDWPGHGLPPGTLIWDGEQLVLSAAGGDTTLTTSYSGGEWTITEHNGNLTVEVTADEEHPNARDLRLTAERVQIFSPGVDLDGEFTANVRFIALNCTANIGEESGGADFGYRFRDGNGAVIYPGVRVIRFGQNLGGQGPGGVDVAGFELGELGSDIYGITHATWRADWLWSGESAHVVSVAESSAGAGRDLSYRAGAAKAGSGAAGGSIYVDSGAGDGLGDDGTTALGTVRGHTRIGRDGAIIYLDGNPEISTDQTLTIGAGATLLLHGSAAGVQGTIFPSAASTYSVGTTALPYLAMHVHGSGGFVVHNDLTNTQRAELVYGGGAYGLGTGWHLQTPTAATNIFLASGQSTVVSGSTAAFLYANGSTAVADLRNVNGTPVLRVTGPGAGEFGAFGTTPVARPAAYTQTYATATRTHAARTAAALTDSTGGTPGTTIAVIPDPVDAPATADDLREDLVINALPSLRNAIASLAAQINALRVDAENTAGVVNQHLDDMQAYGWLQ